MNDDEYNELIVTLAPVGNDTLYKEPFAKYRHRAKQLLPHFPDCVLEHWIYRHYSDIDDYSFLDFRKMRFEKEFWDKDKIYSDVNSYRDNELLDGLGYQLYERYDPSWLQKHMLEHSTWPVPIIVFKNQDRKRGRDGEAMGTPFHLIEGHLRMNYFREIYRREKERLLDSHPVWKVTLTT
ncbi:hypothetical protein [Saccharibacillus deserti]|uniref:hypothetical protein n=1 Tax=Saccharibacillus deserti TaxID=1634444 RepID=UPI001553A787|nr:hypothetical protein [Saccharibacillus deserti]